ncbi:hypothetical protein CRG98_030950 [Punica granatum]|nr:hypothetical protein CRG98_030950 [Punica granatum]
MDLLLPYLNTTMIAVFTSVIFLTYCLTRKIKASRGQQPPEASGGWPILGHLRLLTGPGLPHETLGALADKHGPIFRIRIGIHPAVVISSWEIAKECFTTYDTAISSRPKLASGKHLGYNYANFGFAPYGPYWREMRKITMLELLSNRRLEMFNNIRESEVTTSLKGLYSHWVERRDGLDQDHVPVEMTQWFGDLTLNVILRMVAGKRYNFRTTSTSDEKEKARRVQKTMREMFNLSGFFVPADALPFLRWLDVGGYEKAMKKTAQEMDSLCTEWLEEHREKRNSGEAVNGELDFMDVLLSVLDDLKIADFDADTINKATTTTLVAGGTDTTALTIIWGLSLLLNLPRAMRKVQDELDVHVGRERLVRESDIDKQVYIQAIVKETLRLYPAGPLSGAREFTQDCTIGGFRIPAGTQLIVNLHKLQRDPRVWDDPNEFRPERFLTTHKNIDVKGQHFELIPFGGGRRACPGLGHGIQMAQLTLASLVHAFDIATPSGTPVDMTGSPGLTNSKATPLQVSVKPRLSPSAYR